MQEFRVQLESENGIALAVLFRTTTIQRANEFRNAMQNLNDEFALDHIIATRSGSYGAAGEWHYDNEGN